jgi:translation initiation factor 2B subunit (eIF-2B alpha/beta/delta family)/8-oxo-dGTP pyrophosphatase MutT (NUDIX family)
MAQSRAAAIPNFERRTVVSSLIFPSRPYASKPYRVLLFRRSDKVGTYQRKLAPVAGSVETYDKNPLAAAWREIKEETDLGPQQLELWRRGAGFEFTDEKAVSGQHGGKPKGRIWKVWPFAFRLKGAVADQDNDVSKLGLKLDWEHLGCQWTDVDDVLDGRILDDCVPRLEITLGQLWVDPGSVLHQGLEELRLDHEHGARELATMAIRSLVKIVEHDQREQPPDMKQWWRRFQQQAFHLAFNGRPSMGAAISGAVATALKDAKEQVDATGKNSLDQVKHSLEAYIVRRSQITKQVSDQFSKFLQDRFKTSQTGTVGTGTIKILTLSSSSTIKAAILHALDADESLTLELRILESRPLNEGAGFAKMLTNEAQRRRENQSSGPGFHNRLRIILASDASVGILSKDVDLVVIGADRISEAGDVSNKTGSLAATVVSKFVTNGSVDVVCISESEKIAVPGTADEHQEEDNDKEELTTSWHVQPSAAWEEMVTVRNVYFEWCPAEHIDHYICEYGTLSTEDIRQRSKHTSELLQEVFPSEHL